MVRHCYNAGESVRILAVDYGSVPYSKLPSLAIAAVEPQKGQQDRLSVTMWK